MTADLLVARVACVVSRTNAGHVNVDDQRFARPAQIAPVGTVAKQTMYVPIQDAREPKRTTYLTAYHLEKSLYFLDF